MDPSGLVSCIQRELGVRKGIASLAFQNHLYGCFIVMEDLVQGILEITEGSLTGNSLYLNLDTQFNQIGVRYYGFVMDGKAVLEDVPADYQEAWRAVFMGIREAGSEMADRVEEDIIQLMTGLEENYFMNAMEHDGTLSADQVERVLYLLHPGLNRGKEGCNVQEVLKKRRRLAVTRRQVRAPSRTRWPMTRRQVKV
jgi:hypothetical protein